ncbi:MAG TPA: MFS transporter, partial [Pseudomonas sp.]|nr:MFS transporter [Pseudomonas sp.]
APGYHSLILARFVTGLPHGAYFGVAALVAASMVPSHKRAAAVSQVMLGLTIAILIGNPLATLMGQSIDWRYAFVAVALIALLTMLLVAWVLPLDRSEHRSNPLTELQAFRRIQVWYALGIGAIGFAGMFCVFSYLAVTLLEVTRVSPLVVPVAVATFGAGTLAGNLLGGWLFERLQFRAVAVVLIWSVLVLLFFPFAVQTLWSALLAAFLVGTMVALSPPLQTRLM